ncbi:DNA translocase FtsK [Pseudoalteromonas denitrificans]|uniref:DNA translocase FtsK n=1 Tax=Pseudoalteromonas denitrificans DSM 6059 TaxID=1123010 RepID=A0A1I1SSE0_9GAMM|nr:DNA translocase FtsK [Pseudoalteromonas denitrificans]SFD46823.1 DNA translocase FtsK [Pseudoalteromonas denitrificans DSM 6059]
MRLNGVQRLLETGLIVSTFAAIFILCALVSFDPADPSWSQTGEFLRVKNITGSTGAWVADILLFSFGWLAFFIPVAIQAFGYLFFKKPHKILQLDYLTLGLRVVGLVFFVTTSAAISSINFDDIFYFSSGGVVGDVIANAMMPAFNFTGTSIFLLCFFFAGLTLLTGVSWVQFVDVLGEYAIKFGLYLQQLPQKWVDNRSKKNQETKTITPENLEPPVNTDPDILLEQHNTFSEPEPEPGLDSDFENEVDEINNCEKQELSENRPEFNDVSLEPIDPEFDEINNILEQDIRFSAIEDEPIDTVSALNSLDQNMPLEMPVENELSSELETVKPEVPSQPVVSHMVPQTAKEKFEALLAEKSIDRSNMPPLPTLDLLDRPDKAKNPISKDELEAVSRLVEVKLLDFGIQASVVGVYPGPVVTRFELDLAPGIKVAKITGLAKDLARALSAVSVRVVEVIPGKTYIGLELPNKHREIVRLSEVIGADKFNQNSSPLAMVLGKDIAGEPVVVDLGKMPHLLVAGTTGSGKSVGVNVMIISLLYKSGPDDVRLIMIDPKMLELSVYEGIPHLLCEVVTDMKEASNALRWCVGEMERRYKLMSALGVRNLKGYNQKVLAAIDAGMPIKDPLFKDTNGMAEEASDLEKLPNIVVVIDEFADMMMIVGKKVEELIARIAQKARAAGIHLVLATQRPSVDVITGLIKANIPTRMAFQVSSKIDSRTILDQQGAENLLGMGDMLYLPPGTSVPVRVHGAFIDDHEVHAVVDDWKKRGQPNYIDEILNGDAVEDILLPGEAPEGEDTEQDPLYDEAVSFVIEGGRVSISSVQRKLRVGYNRAARLVEQMEASGIVSAPGHNGARELLVPNANAN